MSTVRGTTTFVSDNVVQPVVSAGSKMAGIRRTAQVLMADLPLQRSKTKAQPFAPPASAMPPASTVTPVTPPASGSTPPAV